MPYSVSPEGYTFNPDPTTAQANPGYGSPGNAVMTELQNILTQKRLQDRQTMLDSLNAQNVQSQIRDRDAAAQYNTEARGALADQRHADAEKLKQQTEAGWLNQQGLSPYQPVSNPTLQSELMQRGFGNRLNYQPAPVENGFGTAATPAPPPAIAADAPQTPYKPGQDQAGAPSPALPPAIPLRAPDPTWVPTFEEKQKFDAAKTKADALARINGDPNNLPKNPLALDALYREGTGASAPAALLEPRVSPPYLEYQDYVKSFAPTAKQAKPLTFDQYQTQDANRKAIREPRVLYTPGGPELDENKQPTGNEVMWGNDGSAKIVHQRVGAKPTANGGGGDKPVPPALLNKLQAAQGLYYGNKTNAQAEQGYRSAAANVIESYPDDPSLKSTVQWIIAPDGGDAIRRGMSTDQAIQKLKVKNPDMPPKEEESLRKMLFVTLGK